MSMCDRSSFAEQTERKLEREEKKKKKPRKCVYIYDKHKTKFSVCIEAEQWVNNNRVMAIKAMTVKTAQ